MPSDSLTTSCPNWSSKIENYIITLCGSTKFKHYFELTNRYLTLDSYTVFGVGHGLATC